MSWIEQLTPDTIDWIKRYLMFLVMLVVAITRYYDVKENGEKSYSESLKPLFFDVGAAVLGFFGGLGVLLCLVESFAS